MEKIAQGAEAILYKQGNEILKDRISKSYRLRIIDEKLRKERTRAEARLLERAHREGVNVPKVIDVDDSAKKLRIEFIDGEKLRDVLKPEHCKLIAQQVEKMHRANIVHGDLTTSNMILKNGEVYLIDFGLASFSEKVEDKAVDLHLFKECLKSKHFKIADKCWQEFEKNYKLEETKGRLAIVEKRGKGKKSSY